MLRILGAIGLVAVLVMTVVYLSNRKVVRLERDVAAGEQRAAELQAELERALADYQARAQVWLEQQKGKTAITVSDAVLFASGSTDFTREGRDIIDRVTSVAKEHPDVDVQIEGHTDDTPIGPNLKDRFPSNWELSASRACSVLRYMYWKHQIAPERLVASAYGPYRPVAPNDTDDGRSKNRRVVILIGPRD